MKNQQIGLGVGGRGVLKKGGAWTVRRFKRRLSEKEGGLFELGLTLQ